ncbi:MAG TPA: glycosyltransferase [Acidimicrobiales bacterium]|nr:glycosyltransferase [Acidimicrobiales bacterium]
MSGARRVVAVVPARNGAGSIGATVAALDAIPEVAEVLVVDDGSTDATAEAARAAGAWVLRLPENRGKGGAVAAAVAATSDTDVYLLVDADTGATAAGAKVLLDPVLTGDADMTIGVLPSAGGRGGFGLVRRLAGAGIRIGAGGFVAKAPLSGQRAVRGELLRSLALAPRFGLEVGLTVDAVRAGARVVEVPVEMDHHHTGRSFSGFTHRARQGADIVRALWPRLVSSRGRVVLILALLLVTVAVASWSGARSAPSSMAPTVKADRVLLVGLPGLRWDDVGTGVMPGLDRLVTRGAVAAMSVRTRSDVPTVSEGYATLGAGSRVQAGPAADEAVERDGRIVVPGAARVRAEAGRRLPTLPGALGDALHAGGRRTAVVGNADLAPNLSDLSIPGHPNVARPAAVALMDSRGEVDGGSVSAPDLLVQEGAPFGRRAAVDVVSDRTLAALADAEVVLVDPGDLERVDAVEDLGGVERYVAPSRAAALAGADEILDQLAARMPPRTLLLVVSVTPPADEWRLTPVVAAGAGVVPGYLHSPSTRRLGLVTLTDVAPTVLAALGAPVPDAMPGRPLRYRPAEADLARLADLDRDGAWRERLWLPVTTAFIVAQVGLWFLTAFLLTGNVPGGRAPWIRRSWLRLAALAVAAFPLATLLLRALPFVPDMGNAGLAVVLALDAAVVALASRARRRPLSALAWILGATVAVLVGDMATGARLQLAGIMGYAPQTASRYFGLGNTAFGVLAGATFLLAALHVTHAPRRRDARVTAAALIALVVFVDGAPFLGADVGGVATLVPVAGLAMLALAGRRLTWRTAGVVGVSTVGVLALLTVADLLRPPEARTHLGRLASATLRSGEGSLLDTLARRAEVTLDVVGQSFWTGVTPVIAIGVVVVLLGSAKARTLVPRGSPARVGLLAAMAAGLIGMAVNDSGVVVVAMVMVLVGPFLALLALADRPGRMQLLEPVGKAARAVIR